MTMGWTNKRGRKGMREKDMKGQRNGRTGVRKQFSRGDGGRKGVGVTIRQMKGMGKKYNTEARRR
jgi:hypothetical protein